MPELSPAGWISLLCLGGITISSVLMLWSAWRKRGKPESNQMSRNKGPSFTRSWEKEDAQLKELSERVKSLRDDKKDST